MNVRFPGSLSIGRSYLSRMWDDLPTKRQTTTPKWIKPLVDDRGIRGDYWRTWLVQFRNDIVEISTLAISAGVVAANKLIIVSRVTI